MPEVKVLQTGIATSKTGEQRPWLRCARTIKVDKIGDVQMSAFISTPAGELKDLVDQNVDLPDALFAALRWTV